MYTMGLKAGSSSSKSERAMTHTPNETHPEAQRGHHASARHRAASQRRSAAQYANGQSATPKPSRPLSMRWSIGPDGCLCCHWQRAGWSKPNQTDEPIGWQQTALSGRRRRQAAAPAASPRNHGGPQTRLFEDAPPSVAIETSAVAALMHDPQRISTVIS
jgi:hypothetical protein